MHSHPCAPHPWTSRPHIPTSRPAVPLPSSLPHTGIASACPGSLARHRFFIPLVWSHLAGFGPRSTLAWLRSCFRHAAKLAISTGSSRHDVDQAYTLLFQVLHKTIVTHHHQALQYLTTSPDDPRSHAAPDTHGPPTANP